MKIFFTLILLSTLAVPALSQSARVTSSAPYAWWRADVSTGSDGADLTTWTDTLNSRTLTAQTSDKPKWRTTNLSSGLNETRLTPNGLAAVEFYDVTNRPLLASLPSGHAQTLILVQRLSWGFASYPTMAVRRSNGSGGYRSFALVALSGGSSSTGENQLTGTVNSAYGVGSVAADAQYWHILTITYHSKAHWSVRINEEPETVVDASGITDLGAMTELQIGSNFDSSTYFTGSTLVASVALYDRVLGETEATGIRAALANMYGIFATTFVAFGTNSTDRLNYIWKPTYVNASRPYKMLIWNHGAGEDRNTPLGLHQFEPVIKALCEDGWLVAASNAYGNHWGYAASTSEIQSLVTHVQANYPVQTAKWVMLGFSMGGLATLNYTRHNTPKPAGIILVGNPVCNLAWAYDTNSNWRTAMCSNYGITNCTSTSAASTDYAAQTSGRDPALGPGSAWPSTLKVRFSISSGDTLVIKANNPDAMATVFTSNVAELLTFTGSGDHGDASMLVPATVVGWANGMIQ